MKLFDVRKTGMIGLSYGEKNYDDILRRFHTIPACHGRTDRQTDRQTDRRTDGRTELVYQYRASAAGCCIFMSCNSCLAFLLPGILTDRHVHVLHFHSVQSCVHNGHLGRLYNDKYVSEVHDQSTGVI